MILQNFRTGLTSALEHRSTVAGNPLIIVAFFAIMLLTTVYIALSVLIAPSHNPAEQFAEDGTITALSAIYLAVGGSASLLGFYALMDDVRAGRFFWLVAGLGLLFLSLDELVQIHERIDIIVSNSQIGKAQTFRNWNDLVVILYGIGGAIGALFFLPELARYRYVLECYGLAFVFFVIHTAIDVLTQNPVAMSIICEESAKLLCVMMLMIASSIAAVSIIDERVHRVYGRSLKR